MIRIPSICLNEIPFGALGFVIHGSIKKIFSREVYWNAACPSHFNLGSAAIVVEGGHESDEKPKTLLGRSRMRVDVRIIMTAMQERKVLLDRYVEAVFRSRNPFI